MFAEGTVRAYVYVTRLVFSIAFAIVLVPPQLDAQFAQVRIDSTFNADRGESTLRVVQAPRLQIGPFTTATPLWVCAANKPCRLSALRIAMTITGFTAEQNGTDERAIGTFRLLKAVTKPG